MDRLLYYVALALVRLLQSLPLRLVARVGRAGGALAYLLDRRHRRVALKNLAMCFGSEKSMEEIRAIARENFRRLGENYASAIKTAAMSWEDLRDRCEFTGEQNLIHDSTSAPPSVVVAVGHFGNFELYARLGQRVSAFQAATTYRGLRQPSLNHLMQALRERSGCLYFERRHDAHQLKATMNRRGIVLGLLADQHAGDHGLRLPFFGHECSTSTAPAVFALRYNCPLHTGFCYRVGLARWRIEFNPEIPVRDAEGNARPIADIMLEVNRAFEAAVRRDPANWFWVHQRWKPSVRPSVAKQISTAPVSSNSDAPSVV